jgi:hypothetical protein
MDIDLFDVCGDLCKKFRMLAFKFFVLFLLREFNHRLGKKCFLPFKKRFTTMVAICGIDKGCAEMFVEKVARPTFTTTGAMWFRRSVEKCFASTRNTINRFATALNMFGCVLEADGAFNRCHIEI